MITALPAKYRHSLVGKSGLRARRAVRIIPGNIVMVQLDLNEKRKFTVFATGSENGIPDIILCPTDDEGNEIPVVGNENNLTTVRLPEFRGHTIWSAEWAKGCVKICLYRD